MEWFSRDQFGCVLPARWIRLPLAEDVEENCANADQFGSNVSVSRS